MTSVAGHHPLWLLFTSPTYGGWWRNPPVDRWFILLFIGFQPSKIGGFWISLAHPQYDLHSPHMTSSSRSPSPGKWSSTPSNRLLPYNIRSCWNPEKKKCGFIFSRLLTKFGWFHTKNMTSHLSIAIYNSGDHNEAFHHWEFPPFLEWLGLKIYYPLVIFHSSTLADI